MNNHRTTAQRQLYRWPPFAAVATAGGRVNLLPISKEKSSGNGATTFL